ncbi:MAG: glycosyltransferase family 4 protein [Actinomycetes bacterium]
MNILYLIPSLGGSGGAEQAVAAMAEPLQKRGIRLDVAIFSSDDALRGPIESAGGRVIKLDADSIWTRVTHMRRLVSERQPDLVHTTLFDADIPGRIAAKLAGVPVVSSLVNVAYGPEQLTNPDLVSWKVELACRADRLTSRIPSRFHALSDHVALTMGARLNIRPELIEVIPRGRDLGRLGQLSTTRRARVRQSLGIDDERPLIIAAARHEFQKGLDVLLRAWPIVRRAEPTAELRLGGRRGAQSPLIDELIAHAGPTSGIVDIGLRDDVPDLLCAADTFVVPSRWEGLGSVLIEAMALGTPVVATGVGPIPNMVGDGWARLVSSDDGQSLADGIVATIRQSAAERDTRASVASNRFSDLYSIDVVANATSAFYHRALGGD